MNHWAGKAVVGEWLAMTFPAQLAKSVLLSFLAVHEVDPGQRVACHPLSAELLSLFLSWHDQRPPALSRLPYVLQGEQRSQLVSHRFDLVLFCSFLHPLPLPGYWVW